MMMSLSIQSETLIYLCYLYANRLSTTTTTTKTVCMKDNVLFFYFYSYEYIEDVRYRI